jgi:hypothetical protein
MVHFLLGCWLGCFGGFMLAALLRRTSDSAAEATEKTAPAGTPACQSDTRHGMIEQTATSAK